MAKHPKDVCLCGRTKDARAALCRSCANSKLAATRPLRSLAERFWPKVDVRGPDECWPWTCATDGRGYGRMSRGRHGETPIRATHVALMLAGRPLEPGQGACHTCDNPPCVNERHLFGGDQGKNLQDASGKGRISPLSLLNLRPGAPGYFGAGPRSRREMSWTA